MPVVYALAALLLVGGLASLLLPSTVENVEGDVRIVRTFAANSSCFYVVHYGDNLFRIGLRYGVSYYYLAALNGIADPNFIYAGMPLAVPCGGTSGTSPALPANCPPSATYAVQPRNNLIRIAMAYGSLVSWIRNANNLWGRVLRPGMTLTIPCPGTIGYRDVSPPEGADVATVEPPPGIVTPTPKVPFAAPPPATSPPTQPPASDANTVKIKNNKFNPAELTVSAGTIVTWSNREAEGGSAYTVTSGLPGAPNGFFDSGAQPIGPAEEFSFKFDTPGIYDYFSRTQDGMTGRIIVR